MKNIGRKIVNFYSTIKSVVESKKMKVIYKMILFSAVFAFFVTNISYLKDYKEVSPETTRYEGYDQTGDKVVFSGAYTADRKILSEITFQPSEIVNLNNVSVQILDQDGDIVLAEYTRNSTIVAEKQTITFTSEQEIVPENDYQIVISIYHADSELTINNFKVNAYSVETAMIFNLFFMIFIPFLVWILRTKEFGAKKETARFKLTGIPLFLFYSFIAFCVIEFLYNDKIWKLSIMSGIGNTVCIFVIFLCLMFLFNSQRAALLVGSLASYILGLSNYFVNLFRSQPIQPTDIFNITTAAEVSDAYAYEMTREIFISTIMVVFMIVVIVQMKERKIGFGWKQKIATRLSGLVVVSLCLNFITSDYFMDQFAIEINQWQPVSTYKGNGFALSFVAFEKNMTVEKPEGYSTKEVEQIKEDTEENYNQSTSGANPSVQKPNIVVIMNETFADLSLINDINVSEPYLSNYNALYDNAIKGHLLMSVFGGGTADSEYEFLTGNSIEQFKSFIVPYVSNIHENQYTMVSTVKAQGYDTYAMHPNVATNWKRNQIYKYFGFDKFYSIDDFTDYETVHNYVSDNSDYEKMIEVIESRDSDDPYFFFNVTMQNHSPYVDTFANPVRLLDLECGVANEYLSCIKESDQALANLLGYFNNVDEPTMVVMFGDHYPSLGGEFYDWLYGTDTDILSMADSQKMYMTPFVIWTNYDIPEQQDQLLSANYLSSYVLEQAGLELTPYNKFLLNMKEQIPAINVNGYYGSDDAWHTFDEETSYNELINTYDILQYNNLMDGGNRVDSFFSIDTDLSSVLEE